MRSQSAFRGASIVHVRRKLKPRLSRGFSLRRTYLFSLKSSNHSIWLKVNAQPLFQPNEAVPYAVVSTFTEISEPDRSSKSSAQHNLSNRTLHQSQDLHEAIFNESTDALFLVDPTTLLTVDCKQRAIEYASNQKQHSVKPRLSFNCPCLSVAIEDSPSLFVICFLSLKMLSY